uniref:Uncharacterized protein n=1 Tax=Oryza punctata TaxID=4537 RepID=A0A0E0MJP9_ORYPU
MDGIGAKQIHSRFADRWELLRRKLPEMHKYGSEAIKWPAWVPVPVRTGVWSHGIAARVTIVAINA